MTRAHTPEELASLVGDALSGVTTVRLAYVFGSQNRGTARSDSDLDVAVVYPRTLDDDAREQARRDILDALTSRLGALGERADIVDLDRSDSAVAFRALRDGTLALARTESERVQAFVAIARRFDDDAPRRQLFRRAAIQAMNKRPHG